MISTLLALNGAAFMATEACAQDSDAGASTVPSSEVDTVVVIGSRSGEATVLNSAAPVQVVSGVDLAESGARTLSEALQSTVPSFSFPTSAASSNAASFVKGVALRGQRIALRLELTVRSRFAAGHWMF